MNILNTDTHTYFISLSWRLVRGKFIFKNGSELMHILKEYDKESKGIDFIKQFDPSKGQFVRISKKDFLNRFNWETEAFLYLQDHYYFKK